MATATCTAFGGAVEGSGEQVGQRLLYERVGFLAGLSRELTSALVASRWNEDALDVLAAGLDGRGEALPSKGWMALRRLGWAAAAAPAEGVYVSDRVRRAAEEYAARTLRLALHRRTMVAAILATWPADPFRRTGAEWAALRALLPATVSGAEIRNRTRQVRVFASEHGRLPAGLCELEEPPQIAARVLLAAMDRQQVTLDRVDAGMARLRVRLPLCAAPGPGRQWAWHVLDLRLPGTVAPEAVLHTPTLRPTRAGRIAVDLPHSRPVAAAPAAGHTVAVGFDWGVSTLLTGALGRLTGPNSAQRVVTDGRALLFDATAISAKPHRPRGHREHLATRRDHYRALADGLGAPHPAWGDLLDKAAVLDVEHARVCARIRRLNQALAWSAARWAVDQSAALGAGVIYLEDLATLEARGRRKGNARLSGQVRGTLVEAIRHLAAKAGIAVVTVPARGTSARCPQCLATLGHHPAPDRLAERGWTWAHCPGCHLSMDRDHAAARRIVSRGLLAQAHTATDRTTGTRTIRTVVDGTVTCVRRPKKATRRLRRAGRAAALPARPAGPKTTPGKMRPTPARPSPAGRSTSSRRMPEARTVPATTPIGVVQRLLHRPHHRRPVGDLRRVHRASVRAAGRDRAVANAPHPTAQAPALPGTAREAVPGLNRLTAVADGNPEELLARAQELPSSPLRRETFRAPQDRVLVITWWDAGYDAELPELTDLEGEAVEFLKFFAEKEFAEKLVKEVPKDAPVNVPVPKSMRRRLRKLPVYVILWVVGVFMVTPLLYALISGFKSTDQLSSNPFGLPSPWGTSNYTSLLGSGTFWRSVGSSTVIAVAATLLTVAVSALAAFALARFAFRGREFVFTLFTMGLMFPFAVAILPLFILLRTFGLLDNPWGVILPEAAFALPVTIIILRGFFREIPGELGEAATLDGCSPFVFFWRILLPLARPALGTVSVLAIVGSWNQFLLPLLVFSEPTWWTIPVGIQQFQGQYASDVDLTELLPHGLGQLTRPFGTAPVDPAKGAARLASIQEQIRAANRFRLPALAHEECLTGFRAWQATVFPTPLAWGASFDPALVKEMAAAIGTSMRAVGIHQGLAPVLDVVRDPRWGRTEESIGEDPHLVATVGTAYVQGLQAAGIVATLKHFAGYSASRGARNHAPASIGPRELADVILPPFEMAVREGGARSVMAAYNDLDGLPAHAHRRLLTELLREEWQFTGTVVADYFGVSFLQTAHQLTDSPAGAAALALAAGVDVELPEARCFGAGPLDEELVDRAVLRVLTQKCELGLLDPDWAPPAASSAPVDFDPPEMRALARRLAEESVVLLANDGTFPLAPGVRRIAVLGPLADDPAAMLGCYTFPRHVLLDHPEVAMGVAVPTLLEAVRAELPDVEFVDDAVAAELCVVVVGDRSGLFGRGTSGEGCDAADLELPDGQGELVDAALASGTPVLLVVLSGRPYALGRWAERCVAVVQAFFPGEEGGPAVAGVLSGRVNPSGRLPVSVPRDPAGQPWTYLAPPLGQHGGGEQHRSHPAVPVRARAVVHDVRLAGAVGRRRLVPDGRRDDAAPDRPQHRGVAGDGGRPAVSP